MVLGFRLYVFKAVFGSEPRTAREAVFDKMAVHRSRRDEENMLTRAVAACMRLETPRGTSKGRGARH